jgi:hypothetical protein
MVNATADLPDPKASEDDDSVKIATPDLILQDEDVMSIDIMTDLIFEDIGGHELATISRHDLVNGQKIIYTPIKNLTDLYLQYNPNNVLRLQSSDSFFKSLSLSILDHLPECGNGYDLVDGVKVPNCKSVYIDPISGDLIINLINIKDGELADVQVLTSGVVYDGKIFDGGN